MKHSVSDLRRTGVTLLGAKLALLPFLMTSAGSIVSLGGWVETTDEIR